MSITRNGAPSQVATSAPARDERVHDRDPPRPRRRVPATPGAPPAAPPRGGSPPAFVFPWTTARRRGFHPVSRVYIYAPIERLKRVEILDTPGFNVPDPDHIAEARRAFDEAHVAVWLLDAPQAMKESERRVLAEISALGVPVQILANKADRLKPDALETVLAHVRDSLAASAITSLTPPIAFSARLSLKGARR
ncbi:GTP-binding protein [Sorangium sp. So ce1078]|uniref:GTP-binding protein n=1 Tax=Sorangium sp. So ce1078 TaxID=3133329 RepID=UPI003F5FB0A6